MGRKRSPQTAKGIAMQALRTIASSSKDPIAIGLAKSAIERAKEQQQKEAVFPYDADDLAKMRKISEKWLDGSITMAEMDALCHLILQIPPETLVRVDVSTRVGPPRLPNGDINNCALANGHPEASCQVCEGKCPDVLKPFSSLLARFQRT